LPEARKQQLKQNPEPFLFRQLADPEGKQVSATLADKQDDILNWNVNNIFS